MRNFVAEYSWHLAGRLFVAYLFQRLEKLYVQFVRFLCKLDDQKNRRMKDKTYFKT